MLSFVCKLMDVIGAGESGADCELVTTGLADEGPNCQNLIVLSSDAEMKEEDYARAVIVSVCPTKVLTR